METILFQRARTYAARHELQLAERRDFGAACFYVAFSS